jgi:hypothetical protein
LSSSTGSSFGGDKPRRPMAGATLVSAREPQIVAWFREANRPALAYGSLAIAAIGYSVGVAYVLSLAVGFLAFQGFEFIFIR